jgi:hypothetical protein
MFGHGHLEEMLDCGDEHKICAPSPISRISSADVEMLEVEYKNK